MEKPINPAWLEPFRKISEMAAVDYQNGFSPPLPRRTALNRLTRLQAAGWLSRIGEGRSTLYRLTATADSHLASISPRQAISPFPAPSQDAIRYLRQSVHLRRPVGYNQNFLEVYQPNVTHYLTRHDRDRLLATGRQPALVDDTAGTYTRHICQRLLIDLSWNSSRLEGNTFSMLETEQLFLNARSGHDSLSTEAVMILNHKAAIEFLLESTPIAGFNRRTILNLHALLAADLLGDPGAEGALRSAPVGIGKSSYLPLAIPDLIESLFDLILTKASAIRDPFEQAFFAMVHLPYLQPFIDGNKRVSRLAANIPLFQHHLAPLSFVDVAETSYTDAMLAIYELNDTSLLREVFLQAYERSAQRYSVIRGAIGEPDPFRVLYRQAIADQVADIIRARCTRPQAAARLRSWAETSVIQADRMKFVTAVEETLSGIHEGNFARYRVRPSEFESWQVAWKSEQVVIQHPSA